MEGTGQLFHYMQQYCRSLWLLSGFINSFGLFTNHLHSLWYVNDQMANTSCYNACSITGWPNGKPYWHVDGMANPIDMLMEWQTLLTCWWNGKPYWHVDGMVNPIDMLMEW